MLDIKLIRKDPQYVIDRLRIKNFDATDLVYRIIKLDEEVRQKKKELDYLRHQLKIINYENRR